MLKRRVTYVLSMGTFIAVLVIGLQKDVQGAQNVAFVMAWVLTLLSPMMLFPGVAQELAKHGRAIPAWFDVSLELFVIVFMVWHGWIVTGSAYAVHLLLHSAAWSAAKTLRESGLGESS